MMVSLGVWREQSMIGIEYTAFAEEFTGHAAIRSSLDPGYDAVRS
jgi:hypothetical protein